MLYLQRCPAPPLDRFVESIWVCRNDPRPFALERVLPSAAAQLLVNLAADETRAYEASGRGMDCRVSAGSIVSGVSTRFQIIDTAEQEHVAGVVFRPGGTVAFMAGPARE